MSARPTAEHLAAIRAGLATGVYGMGAVRALFAEIDALTAENRRLYTIVEAVALSDGDATVGSLDVVMPDGSTRWVMTAARREIAGAEAEREQRAIERRAER